MASLVPIPTSRVSSSFVRQRLQAQLQGDQLDLFRLQNQISTGRRISRAGEDAPAAQRAITLQRLIERKTQLASNVSSGNYYLAATDQALSDVAAKLGDVRGAALGVANTSTTQTARDEVAGEIDRVIEALMGVANKRFLGRYLFAGSQTNVQPYERSSNVIRYNGNEKTVDNFSDIDVLFSTNATGASVFGGLSSEVRGSVDLNPQLTSDTLLSGLRGGRGLSSNGALRISDGTNESIVDISGAVTIGDVIRAIEESPPAGRTVTASINTTGATLGAGITLQLDSVGGGNLTVHEVGSGTAARELGIFNDVGTLTNPLVGGNLDPTMLKTTRVDSLLGSRATARVTSAGSNNDLLIEAAANGAAYNGVTIQFVDDDAPGAESATLAAGTLTVHIASGASTAQAVANAINAQGTFTARLDPTDTTSTGLAGSGFVTLASTAVTAGGSGTNLDLAAGIRVQNGGQSHAISFAGAQTVEDLLNILNGSDAGLSAAINDAGTGIDVRSRFSGSEFQIGENGGATATQLGLRTFSTDLRLEDLNHGVGVMTNDDLALTITTDQLAITTRDGNSFNVNLSTAPTVADAIVLINLFSGGAVTAQPVTGGGVRFLDNTQGTGALGVAQTGSPVAIPGGIPTQIEVPDISIATRSGQNFNINLSGAETIGDVISKINAATGGNVTAQLAAVGNGLQFVDNTAGAGQLTITADPTSQAAEYLGLVPKGSSQATSTTGVLVGADQNFTKSNSVFTTLLKIRDAISAGDNEALELAISLIDEDINRTTFARADAGARQQALDIAKASLEDEDVLLKSALSEEIEVDLVEAISNLTARQVSLQASLKSISSMMQLSLLDYL